MSRSAPAFDAPEPMLAVKSVAGLVDAPVMLLPPSKMMALPATMPPEVDCAPAVLPDTEAESLLSLTVTTPLTWVTPSPFRKSTETPLALTVADCGAVPVVTMAVDCRLLTPTVPVNADESAVDLKTLTAALLVVLAVMLFPLALMLLDNVGVVPAVSETFTLAVTDFTSAAPVALKTPC